MRAAPLGASAVFMIATAFPIASAQAQGWRPFFYDEPPVWIERDDMIRRQPPRRPIAETRAKRHHPSQSRASQNHQAQRTTATRAAKAMQIPTRKPEGPLTIAISISQQRLKIYDTQGLFAESPISSGKPGHSTPRGVFSIIQKRKWHRSNLYANAPMPYMQRITWSGVALHAGIVPGYPASHGCVRLPNAFAARLWTWTRPGARVVITQDELTPAEIAHPLLASLVPAQDKMNAADKTSAEKTAIEKPDAKSDSKRGAALETKPQSTREKKTDTVTGLRLTLADDGALADMLPASTDNAVHVAQNDDTLPKPGDKDEYDAGMEEPANIGTASSAGDLNTKDQNGKSDSANADAPKADATHVDAAKADAAKTDVAKTGMMKDDAAKTDAPKIEPAKSENTATIPAALPAPPASEGHIAMFVSRKARKLFVRRNFMPWFDVPLDIAQPDSALGTHVFTARQNAADKNQLSWTAITLPQPASKDISAARHAKRGQKKAIEVQAVAPAPATAAQALDRINLPKPAMDIVAPLLAAGASLVISDAGLGPETGRGTDFIVLTR